MDYYKLLQSPDFYLGILVGLALAIWWYFHERSNLCGRAKTATRWGQHLIDTLKKGKEINLDAIYPGRKQIGLSGLLAWEALAFWRATKYAEYAVWEDEVEFWEVAEICFGDSVAFIKLQALDEILNSSTRYLVKPDGSLFDKHDNPDLTKLYKMVASIVDSYEPDVYERSRKKQSHT